VGRRRVVLRTRAAHLRRAVVTDITRITGITDIARVARIAGVTDITRIAGLAGVTVVLLAQGCETLLLGEGVDVGTNDEGYQVEEGDPELVREELLGKGQADGGGEPGDAHDSPEADLDGGANLVEGSSAGNESHGDQVDAVLDRSNL
jgi:hypothetical protein